MFFLPLPEAKQKEILDFAEFLFLKYSNEAIGENQGISNQPSEELLALLNDFLYAVFYIIEKELNKVVILAIIHKSRNPDFWKKK